VGLTIFDEREPILANCSLTITDTTVYKVLVPAVAASLRIDSILVVFTGAADHGINVALFDPSSQMDVGSRTVPASAGLNGAVAYDLIPTLAPAAIGGFVLPRGASLKVRAGTTLGGADTMIVTALGGYI
jgi:hypothetical protein